MHVLFYDDYHEVGGHELMTAHAVRYLARSHAVTCIVYEHNLRLLDILREIQHETGKVSVIATPFRSRRLQECRSFLDVRAHLCIRAKMIDARPDVVVVAQGRIELSTLGVLAGKTARLPVVSYLPMAHPLRLAGTRFGAALRERVDSVYYRMPDLFVTCTEGARKAIQSRNKRARVVVVPNGLDYRTLRINPKAEARAALDIDPDRYLITVVGRVDYRQKGQDVILAAMQARELPQDVHLLVVGDGPDKADLLARVMRGGLSGRVTLLPWSTDMATIYGATDMVAIPSRYEGYPLVLLEALYHRLPVIGASVDAMADVLDDDWLFPSGDYRGLANAFNRARGADASRLTRNHEHVIRNHSLDQFGAQFERAISHAVA